MFKKFQIVYINDFQLHMKYEQAMFRWHDLPVKPLSELKCSMKAIINCFMINLKVNLTFTQLFKARKPKYDEQK